MCFGNLVHPVIKIILTVVLSALACMHTTQSLIAVISLALAGYTITSLGYLKNAANMMYRLRWFFLSILIVYLWLTPGEPVFAVQSVLAPSIDGLIMGASRLLSLLAVILVVNLMLTTTRAQELFPAISWLASPLSLLGISRERIAVRLVLTMQTIASAEQLCRECQEKLRGRSFYQKAATALGEITDQIQIKANQSALQELQIEDPGPPPVYQWGFIAVVLLLFIIVNHL